MKIWSDLMIGYGKNALNGVFRGGNGMDAVCKEIRLSEGFPGL